MIKKFKNNLEYFTWYNRNKEKYKVIFIKIYKKSLVVEFYKI